MAEATLLTPGQVAERLQVKERTVLEWLRAGELRGLKLGRLWRVHPADLERFLTAAAAPRRRGTSGTPSRRRSGTGATKRRPKR